MLSTISWSSYWTVIVIGLAIYYSILVVLLYQNGMFFKGRVKFITSKAPERESSTTLEREPSTTPQQDLFGYHHPDKENGSGSLSSQPPVDEKMLMPLVHDLTSELKGFITDISERSYIKEEVVMGIQLIIKSYKKLEGSAYQKSINDFIKNECEEFCSIHLSEEDIKRIWIG